MRIQRICPKGEDFEEKIDNEKGIRYCPKIMTHESYGCLKVDDNNRHIKIDIDYGFFRFPKITEQLPLHGSLWVCMMGKYLVLKYGIMIRNCEDSLMHVELSRIVFSLSV